MQSVPIRYLASRGKLGRHPSCWWLQEEEEEEEEREEPEEASSARWP